MVIAIREASQKVVSNSQELCLLWSSGLDKFELTARHCQAHIFSIENKFSGPCSCTDWLIFCKPYDSQNWWILDRPAESSALKSQAQDNYSHVFTQFFSHASQQKWQRGRARAPAGCATRRCHRATLLGLLWGLPPQDTACSFCHNNLRDNWCRPVPSFGATSLGSRDFTFGANLRTASFPTVSSKSFQGCWPWIIWIGCLSFHGPYFGKVSLDSKTTGQPLWTWGAF